MCLNLNGIFIASGGEFFGEIILLFATKKYKNTNILDFFSKWRHFRLIWRIKWIRQNHRSMK